MIFRIFLLLIALLPAVACQGFDLRAELQAAFDSPGPDLIEIPEGVTEITETLKVPSYTTIVGKGMEHSEIYIKGRITGLDFGRQSHVTFRDFAITHRADKPRYGGGGFGLDGGRGNGSATDSSFVTIDRVWVHDIQSVGITNYRGSKNWSVTNCRIERCGRGGISGNGWRNAIFANNYFGETGDDGLGLNGTVLGCTVTGNVFYRCGAVGVTPASGIRCSGTGTTITGNTFRECHTAITFDRQITTPRDRRNREGDTQYNVASDNTVWMCNDSSDYEVGSYIRVAAIKVKGAHHTKLCDNNVCAVTPNGRARCALWIEKSSNIESSGNTYIGSVLKFAGGGENESIEFHRDTFRSLSPSTTDLKSNVLLMVGHSISVKGLRFEECRFDTSIGTYVRAYKNASVDATFQGCRLISPVRIGFLSNDLQPGKIERIPIAFNLSQEYRGLRAFVPKGKRLRLRQQGHDQELIAVRDHNRGEFLLDVEPFELGQSLDLNRTWIEWGESDSVDGASRLYCEHPGSASVELTLIDNQIPDVRERE